MIEYMINALLGIPGYMIFDYSEHIAVICPGSSPPRCHRNRINCFKENIHLPQLSGTCLGCFCLSSGLGFLTVLRF